MRKLRTRAKIVCFARMESMVQTGPDSQFSLHLDDPTQSHQDILEDHCDLGTKAVFVVFYSMV